MLKNKYKTSYPVSPQQTLVLLVSYLVMQIGLPYLHDRSNFCVIHCTITKVYRNTHSHGTNVPGTQKKRHEA